MSKASWRSLFLALAASLVAYADAADHESLVGSESYSGGSPLMRGTNNIFNRLAGNPSSWSRQCWGLMTDTDE